jgi:lia operon protein LiaG
MPDSVPVDYSQNKINMKKIHLIATLAMLFLFTKTGFAQEFKISVENTKEGKLTLSDLPNDIPIEGYAGNEIIITSDRMKETPERAKGLKPVYAGGTDNTGLALSVEKNGNQVNIQCLLSITQSANYRLKVPDNFSLRIISGCARSGSVSIQNMKNEVEINVCQSIRLKNVPGPLVLSTVTGNIDVSFSELSKDKPISIASVSGQIDVTLSAKSSVNLEMGTFSGNMYSDFEFQNDKKELRRIGGNSINTELNGGGVDLKITSVTGNIYLRKG